MLCPRGTNDLIAYNGVLSFVLEIVSLGQRGRSALVLSFHGHTNNINRL